MAAALEGAVAIGSGEVRSYLCQRPMGDFPGDAAAGTTANGDGVASIATAMAYIAEGQDAGATTVLDETLRDKPSSQPSAVALLALTYLLQGRARRQMTPA